MSKRIRSIVIAAAAIAALATGGAVFAQAQNATPESTAEPAQVSEAAEAAEGSEAAGKEVPDDDGPGGHADEPGNPNADHQFEGKE
jgi:hypothetical protein